MAFDSLPGLAAAAILFAACVIAWNLCAKLKTPARLPLRFAAMLLASLAVAAAVRLGDVTALLLLPLASAALASGVLARFARPLPPLAASLVLVMGLACGFVALLTGVLLPALLLMLLCALAIIAAALNGIAPLAALSGAALLAAGLAYLQGGATVGVLLLCAAAMIGLSRTQLLRSTSSAMRGAAAP